jgi:asparagine synthase (glutamine-hydrolysing)
LHGSAYTSEADRQTAIAALIAANPVFSTVLGPDWLPAAIGGVEEVRRRMGFCPTWIGTWAKGYKTICELMRPDAPVSSDIDAPYAQFLAALDIPGRVTGRDAVNASLYTWQKTMLVNFILTILGDRMEMAHSIEGRVPFLDHYVAEYAAALPVHFKIRDTTEKYVLREAARYVITQELYTRQKHPFVAPPLNQKEAGKSLNPLRERCEEIVRSPSFADQPFFEPKKVIRYLDTAAKGDAQMATAASPILLRLATFSLMQQRFGITC